MGPFFFLLGYNFYRILFLFYTHSIYRIKNLVEKKTITNKPQEIKLFSWNEDAAQNIGRFTKPPSPLWTKK